MIWIRCAVVIRLVAAYTSVRRIVIISVVTIHTIDGRVCPIQYPIVVVDRERCRLPIRGSSMTHGTIRRDIQGLVVRICAAVVIRIMAAHTSVWRIVVIPVMAGIAVICYRGMRSGQWVKRIVVESRGHPGRF